MANILLVVRWIFSRDKAFWERKSKWNKIIMYYSASTYHGNNRSTGHVFHQPRKERKMTQVGIMRSQMVFTGLLNKVSLTVLYIVLNTDFPFSQELNSSIPSSTNGLKVLAIALYNRECWKMLAQLSVSLPQLFSLHCVRLLFDLYNFAYNFSYPEKHTQQCRYRGL